MIAEDEGPAARARKKRRWIVGVSAGAILILAAAGTALIFKPLTAPAANEEGVTANFADLNIADAEKNAAIAPVNSVDMNATTSLESTEPAAWDYFDTYDQVRGGTIRHASMESGNTAYFDFPYGGGSNLTMTVRRHPAYGDDVVFKISKGQFVCHVDACTGTINFGSGPETISLSEPDDNSSDTLFASDGGYIISRLKTAKKVIIELPFFQEGNRQFTFEMKTPLDWPATGSVPSPKPSSPIADKEPTDEELNEAFPPQKPPNE